MEGLPDSSGNDRSLEAAEYKSQGFHASNICNGQYGTVHISTGNLTFNFRPNNDLGSRLGQQSNRDGPVTSTRQRGKWRRRPTIIALSIVLVTIGVLVIVLPLVLGRNNLSQSEKENNSPTSSAIILSKQTATSSAPSWMVPSSPASSAAIVSQTRSANNSLPSWASGFTASSATGQPSFASLCCTPQSLTSTTAPPQITADGLYLLNFNSSVIPSVKGSALFWYANMDLGENVDTPPNSSVVLSWGEYCKWEQNNITGLFDQTDTVFDAVINESLEQIRPLPINSAVGYGNNGNSLSGQRYRNFTVFKGSGEQLYQNDTSNLRYFPVYYAA